MIEERCALPSHLKPFLDAGKKNRLSLKINSLPSVYPMSYCWQYVWMHRRSAAVYFWQTDLFFPASSHFQDSSAAAVTLLWAVLFSQVPRPWGKQAAKQKVLARCSPRTNNIIFNTILYFTKLKYNMFKIMKNPCSIFNVANLLTTWLCSWHCWWDLISKMYLKLYPSD